ncbi:hypothetical protein TVAG_278420 [Trichomonas vaginalis G3]|uniref:receptor protein-tyrosine kinase n=1 Tax=Trichomonas vaginalis (strain ATCC PRA-98 / G3) TaxID=412133 RepID=A2DU83_TRIV3|nr:glycine-rich protein family [Trichomonas vaginalis G3]EAY16076.1 hypothetical protein TVAG_278420 [Trichomonas vaginalis G3]KAI5537258.1 glycine-rich protein family [Trichomonas vaginalis G3]|eukprot:XP_001328299.1 hypothetical protein [Trichomonas vaginalis G3]
MVAGGGGGSEWPGSTGGHAGGLVGGVGQTVCKNSGWDCSSVKSGGGTQISGGSAAPTVQWISGIRGLFGKSPINYKFKDMGGIGGNGYYSGASVNYTGSGGGGSSFISGYEGCIALNSSLDETPSPTNSPIHYSGIFFTNPIMIEGNKNMPLYYSPISRGIGNKGRGAIRITILLSQACSCNNNICLYLRFSHILYLGLIVS